jgi:hypothetical protein
MKWTVSPAEIEISFGSNTRLPPAPIDTSTAHTGAAIKMVKRKLIINFIIFIN